jgi:ABC-type uncharacterized transport system permease subunit
LPRPETVVFLSAVLIHLVAAIVGILQLLSGGQKYKHFLSPLISLAVALEAVILIFRAVELKAIPLTGLFESMIVLTIVFGLIYLFFSIAIGQVWFGSVMSWVILTMIVMAGIVARPASEPDAVAATPWAVAHGIAMILGGASITFATASAFLSLLGRGKLKRKEVMQVLGKVPNIERLERMNLLGVRVGFVLLTIGLISGFGLASMLGTGPTKSGMIQSRSSTWVAWLADVKVVSIIVAWILLGIILVSNRMLLLKGKMRAYLTAVVFVLVLFAILGVTVLGATQHNFTP